MARTRKDKTHALTTGQAARYCLVTSDTIVNWIKSGFISAQRTAGGQYRILVEDLREFMRAKGMDASALEERGHDRPHYWIFHSRRSGTHKSSAICDGCITRYLGVLHCYRLMGQRPGAGHQYSRCEECGYYRRWAAEAEKNSTADRLRKGTWTR